MLALPAVIIWRRESESSRIHSRPHSLILLSCVMALLFPVVSATDDLHPISTEMEDAFSKRVVKQSPAAKYTVWSNAAGLHARLVSVAFFGPRNETWEPVPEFVPVVAVQTRAGTAGCRAPPAA